MLVILLRKLELHQLNVQRIDVIKILCSGLLVTGLSLNTNSADIVLCYTESEVSMATLCWSCSVHYWHCVTHTCWCTGWPQCSTAWLALLTIFTFLFMLAMWHIAFNVLRLSILVNSYWYHQEGHNAEIAAVLHKEL